MAFTGCAKDDVVNDVANRTTITATFESEAPSTRLNITDDNALTWSAGDSFALFGEGSSAQFTLQSGAGSATAVFTGTAPSTILGAAFPYTDEYNPALSSETLSMTLPAELDHSNNGVCNLPMWAATTSATNIAFKHLAGVLRSKFTDMPEGYNTLIVTASNPISGAFTATTTDDEPVLASTSEAAADKKVTVEFTAATEDENDNVFYIPLPVGEYESIEISVSNGEDTKNLITYNDKEVERAKVYTASLTYSGVTGTLVTEVDSEEELKAAVTAGKSVVLTDDIDLTAAVNIPQDVNASIDLNGKTITANSSTAFNVLNKGASLTIGGEGMVTAAGHAIANYGGTLTVNGGTYKTNGEQTATIYCDGAVGSTYGNVDSDWHLTINDGTFISEKFTSISLQNNYYQLNPEGSATLNGGTFTSGGGWYDLYVGCAKATVDFDNCTFTNGRVYAKAEPSLNPAAPAYINGIEYSTDGLVALASTADNLASVINNGGYVVLTADIELSVALNVANSKNVNINLNGKTITANTSSAFNVLNKDASLTIGGEGMVIASGHAIANYGGTLTVNGGTYKTNGEQTATIYCDGAVGSTYGNVDSDWHLTINDGTFISEKFTSISLQNNYYQLNPEGSATLNAGTFTANENWYDLHVGCAKVTYNEENCTFTNGRIHTQAEPTLPCPAVINGVEYLTNGLINQ